MRLKLWNFWPQILILITIFAFFGRLFFPPSIFVNPDFGRSDILHIALAQKYELSKSLKDFSFTFWEDKAGNGYPLSADALDTFYLPGLILILLLPFQYAIPSLYVAVFAISGLGMVALLRDLKIGKSESLFGAVAFTFSAATILRVHHIAIVQALSAVPWVFLFFFRFLKKPSLKNAILTSLFLSQVALSYPQIFLYCLIFLFAVGFFYYLKNKWRLLLFASSLLLITFYTVALGAIQLLPTYQLLKQTTRSGGMDPSLILTQFPFQPKNLLTYLDPYILGKASNGTYNSVNWKSQGIFWENTNYIGTLPFLFAGFAILYLVLKRPKRFEGYIAICLLLSVSLALGKYSPTHVIFSFPPLSYFRVPSRFILFSQFFAAILAGYGLGRFSSLLPKRLKGPASSIVVAVTIFQLLFVWWNYNPIGKTSEWIKKPELASYVQDHSYNTLTIDSGKYWNDIFGKHGWEGQEEYYKFFFNSLEPNLNYFYGLKSFTSYQVLPTRRQGLAQSFLPLGISRVGDSVAIDALGQKILNLFSIKYLVTTAPIESNYFSQLGRVEKDNYQFYLYENKDALAQMNLYYDYRKIDTINGYRESLEKIDPKKTALIEKFSNNLSDGKGTISLTGKSKTKTSVIIDTDKDALLVYNNSYYPAWKAKLDGKQVQIYPANMNSMAVFVPEGSHSLEFYFSKSTYILGAIITLTSVLAGLLFTISRKPWTFSPRIKRKGKYF